jgi:endonuclease-3
MGFFGTIPQMTEQKLRERILRVKKMNTILRKLFPSFRIHLQHGNTWELLVAVILSAQCTDKRVNEVTAVLFKKYRTMEAYAHAPQAEMEKYIFQTGFYRAKAKYIRTAAQAILREHAGVVPSTMGALIALPRRWSEDSERCSFECI